VPAGEELVFGRFTLCPRRRSLHADGVPIELGARAFDLLTALALSNGRLLGKDELMSLAWPGLVVEENNLHVQIGAVRRALGALPAEQRRVAAELAPTGTPAAAAGGVR